MVCPTDSRLQIVLLILVYRPFLGVLCSLMLTMAAALSSRWVLQHLQRMHMVQLNWRPRVSLRPSFLDALLVVEGIHFEAAFN